MKQMTIKDLVNKLNKLKNEEIQLNFEGTILMNQNIELDKIIETVDYLEIYNKKNNENIKLNIHQIMKIEMVSIEKFLIQFDGFQNIMILVKNKRHQDEIDALL